MKRLVIAIVAALSLLSSPGVTPATAQQDRRPGQHEQDQRGQGPQDRTWNPSAHNGYTYKNKWHYGPPPAAYQARPDFSPGYQQWRKGQRLPAYYRKHYGAVNYQAERLRRPRHGYHWVRDERGNYLMVAIASGIIADLILNASH